VCAVINLLLTQEKFVPSVAHSLPAKKKKEGPWQPKISNRRQQLEPKK
jgi:hypothetical protein